jgi:hypothetical protein
MIVVWFEMPHINEYFREGSKDRETKRYHNVSINLALGRFSYTKKSHTTGCQETVP